MMTISYQFKDTTMGCAPSSRVYAAASPSNPSGCTTGRINNEADGSIRQFHSKMSLAHRKASLAALLKNVAAARHFRAFLAEDFAEANLDFYDAVSALQLSDATPEDLGGRAKEVIERYVLPGSESEVNLPSALRSACQASVEQRVSLLSKAQEEILLLLAFDTYPRFLKSAAYAAMIAELSSGVAAHPSAQVDLCLSGSSHRYGGSASAFSGEPSDGGVPVPSEEPLSWLERFIRLADLLPGCITLAEVTRREGDRGGGSEEFPLVYVNAAFLRLTGYSWEEVQNRNCRFLQGPQTDPATVAAMRKALAEHRPVRVEILNYRKGGSSFRNLLALKFVTEFASESDAAANRNGVPRYVLGVQFEATSHTMVDARLVDLDAFVAMLPSVYVTPVVTAENVGSRNPSMQFSLQRSSTPQKLPSPRITSATHSFSRRVHSAIALPASAVTADNHAAVSGFELSQAPG